MAWDQRFFDPIIVPKGKPLVTLRDAGNYVASLPEREQHLPHWQTVAELLLMVGDRGGDPMMVRIAMMQALNHGNQIGRLHRAASAPRLTGSSENENRARISIGRKRPRRATISRERPAI